MQIIVIKKDCDKNDEENNKNFEKTTENDEVQENENNGSESDTNQVPQIPVISESDTSQILQIPIISAQMLQQALQQMFAGIIPVIPVLTDNERRYVELDRAYVTVTPTRIFKEHEKLVGRKNFAVAEDGKRRSEGV